MCDTIIALPEVTKTNSILFGKNSDREPDETQNIEIIPHRTHSTNSTVQCTYLEIPQVLETNRILLSKPFWMWGAEMGANEYGVVIGNEALLTKIKPKQPALTGMDLLRLALERARTAADARDIIIDLLENYGQGGKCGYRDDLYYNNGFIIADPKEAFVLETVEEYWAWKRIQKYYSISNLISIQQDYDAIHPDLIHKTIQRGWCTSESDFNFRKNYSDKLISWGAAGLKRQKSTRKLLKKKAQLNQPWNPSDIMDILRYHTSDLEWAPDQGLRMTVCAHAGNGLTKGTQTTCSLVADLGSDTQRYYTTGASNPCISPFFPIFINNTHIPTSYHPGKNHFNPESFWWRMEQIHRLALFRYRQGKPLLDEQRIPYEQKMIHQISNTPTNEISQIDIDRFFNQTTHLMEKWWNQLVDLEREHRNIIYRRFWNKYNHKNKIFDP